MTTVKKFKWTPADTCNWPVSKLTQEQLALCKHLMDKFSFCSSYECLPSLMDFWHQHQNDDTKFTYKILFSVLGHTWTLADNIINCYNELLSIFSAATRNEFNLMMSDKEFKEWKKLPDKITAYRFCYPNNRNGFSFSLSRKKALRFSKCWRYQQMDQQPLMLTASIPKASTVLKLDRNEKEIIFAKIYDRRQLQAFVDSKATISSISSLLNKSVIVSEFKLKPSKSFSSN